MSFLKGGNSFSWSVECQTSFDKIKSFLSSPPILYTPCKGDKFILSSPPILYTPCKGDKFILETDASDIGIGGCLKAKNDQCEYIVGYCSKKFSNSELNWNIVEKEAFAVVHNIRHFQHFLVGCPFTVRCDNRVVTYLQTKHQPRNKKLLHWALELSEYDYTITHIPSKNNTIRDSLSLNSFDSTKHNIDNHFKIDEFAIAQQNHSCSEIHSAK